MLILFHNLLPATTLLAFLLVNSADAYSGEATAGQADANLPQVSSLASAKTSAFQREMYSQSFRAAKHCLESMRDIRMLNGRLTVCNSKTYGQSDPQECANLNGAMQAKLLSTQGKADWAMCSKDPQILRIQYGDATVKAAVAGDTDAQICYIEGQWSTSSPGDAAAYKEYADIYIKQAFARGDWRVVQLFTISSESIGHGGGGRRGNLPGIGSPFTVYRANRLLQLGAAGAYAKLLNSTAQDAMRSLTPAQIKKANLWARSEFNGYFTTSPKLSSKPVACIIYGSPTP